MQNKHFPLSQLDGTYYTTETGLLYDPIQLCNV